MSELKQEFENWAISHGGLSLIPANGGECGNGWFPATYAHSMTEIAWRAFANRRTQPEATKPAQDESDEDTWRRLALQFDGHRMMALSHLRAMLQDAQKHKPLAEEFLKAPPLDGEVILAQRVASLAPAQDLSAAILALPLPMPWSEFVYIHDSGRWAECGPLTKYLYGSGTEVYTADQMRDLLKAAAALASPADALVAGDRVDAERTGTLYQAVQRAAGELPDGWAICLEIERDAGTVELIDPEGNRKLVDGNDGYLCQAINEATNAAIQAQKDGHG